MQILQYLFILCFVPLCLCQAAIHRQPTSAAKAKYDLYRTEAYNKQIAVLKNRTSGCTLKNVKVRKEWSTLSLHERRTYVNAVLCLQSKSSVMEPGLALGAITHFDDFAAVHINQTAHIHVSSYFLPWHRYFLHAYEDALQECGYSGGQPYWDWSAGDVTAKNNALFSGPGSLGGNGESIAHADSAFDLPAVPPIHVVLPAGTGGGCITDGPFVNYTVNLGPGAAPDGLGYHPRCLVRDFRPWITNVSHTYEKVTETLALPDFTAFQDGVEAGTREKTGIHAAGHSGVGGDMFDLYSSPTDPAFVFHHAQVDHIWLLWQAQDFENRTFQIGKTLTFSNSPPSAPGTPDTPTDLGPLGGTYKFRDLASTIDGPFCYIYDKP